MKATHHLILGGQRSGKSRHAELLALEHLQGEGRSALLLATAQAGDPEMIDRIVRHRIDRAARAPGLLTEEVPVALPQALRRFGERDRLLVVDCLTLWATNLLMPLEGLSVTASAWDAACQELLAALEEAPGPVILVSNEIGLGLTPMTRATRRFVDDLGRLHQALGARCHRVTLMVAGQALAVKGGHPCA